MNDKPNPADFSVNDRPREYDVIIRVEGKIRRTVKADCQSDADAQAEKIADEIAGDACEADLDDVDDVRVWSCRRPPPMFRVIRDGQNYQVGRLLPGDLPREPDERGF